MCCIYCMYHVFVMCVVCYFVFVHTVGACGRWVCFGQAVLLWVCVLFV